MCADVQGWLSPMIFNPTDLTANTFIVGKWQATKVPTNIQSVNYYDGSNDTLQSYKDTSNNTLLWINKFGDIGGRYSNFTTINSTYGNHGQINTNYIYAASGSGTMNLVSGTTGALSLNMNGDIKYKNNAGTGFYWIDPNGPAIYHNMDVQFQSVALGYANDFTISNSTGRVTSYYGMAINSPTTTVNGSTSGTCLFNQTMMGNGKEVWIQLVNLVGTATYTFPVGFTYTPTVGADGVLQALVTSIGTTSVTITGTGQSGLIKISSFQ
jgi:hypothetical protein